MTLSQAHETLARCGNKIEMFVIREDLLSPRKGKEPPVVKAVVHNPYNSPLSLYSTENIAETLAKQTEVLTEGQVSEEDEGPENLSFKQKSAVFQLLEEQAKQEGASKSRGSQQSATVTKPKTAPPPPPPKPKPPSSEYLYNGYDSDRQIQQQQQVYQDQQKTSRVEYQTTQRVVSQQHQYQQERPVQYQQTTTYQTSAFQKSPGYHSPSADNYQQQVYHSQVNSYQQSPGYQQSVKTYQQTHQQINQSNQQQYPGYQSPTTTTFQPLNQINYQQSQSNPSRGQTHQGTQHQTNYQTQTHQSNYQPQKTEQPTTAVSKAVFKIGPPPPPRGSSAKQQDSGDMAAVYRQQYEQHLQQQYEQQQMYMNNYDDYESTKSTVTELPKTGFNPAAVREQGTGRRCIWPPPKPEDEMRSGRNTPQSPMTGRRIQWNPSPSPPLSRRTVFSTSQSPVRRKDLQWPPPSPTSFHDKENVPRFSPKTTRKARFDDYIKEHASINVPQTYRPPPGTQHVEYR
ncbi:transcription factor SPT20 homolog isoform X3 [Stegodyphus dumicola]|uniref:transcription factor SPT20 homolog isoform X3 n=1 Tax=Stegodyphus dumicola TaxID=202533 RepID=UPI0015B01A97|nr:transcription factor SPT20 homolog isoform X3 [Stegodyphus dumicola]